MKLPRLLLAAATAAAAATLVLGHTDKDSEIPLSDQARGAQLAASALALESSSSSSAHKLWMEAAALGNETAQFNVGVMHAWGLHGLAKDERQAILYFYFSALGGHVPAQMTLAYRHSRGDGVPLNCKTASMYGELASNTLTDRFQFEHMVEPSFAPERVLGVEEFRPESKQSELELIDYYLNLASKGDFHAMGALGKIYFYGSREVARDLVRSYRLLLRAATEGDLPAMSSLGHLLLRGIPEEGIASDPMGAFANFSKAAESGSAAAYNGLGYMYLFGHAGVVQRDVKKAVTFFTKATEGNGNVAEAFYNLGAIHASGLDGVVPRDFVKAYRHFSLATQKGSVLALHKMAHMSLHGLGTMRNCKAAVNNFKIVSERTLYALEAKRAFAQAYALVESRRFELAYELYLRLAEMGFEAAEINAARVLDIITSTQDDAELSPDVRDSLLNKMHTVLDMFKLPHPPLQTAPAALRLYERAAEQGNTRARLRVGDFWFYNQTDYQEAALQYRIASEGANAQAHFNLAYQHHHGLGLVKDLQLAKRYYDMAFEASPDSKLAVYISLALLWWENMQGSWRGENLVTIGNATSGGSGNGNTGASWMDAVRSVELDSILIAFLLLAFFAVGLYRDWRLNRLRRDATTAAAAQQQQEEAAD